jgi:putative ABC transport system ATP-binding protein
MTLIRVENVSKRYLLGHEEVWALRDVSLTIHAGVFMAIAGPSGSGKSTLLNLIGCIDSPTRGRIVIDGRDTSGQSMDELAGLRATTIGFIFQTFNLFPVLTAAENVEYPLLQRADVRRDERRARVGYYLDLVGLSRYAKHRPNQLSGGQRQRVAIARALAVRPRLILADEPTANLDHRTGEGILELMKHVNKTLGTTFVFSTHDKKVIAKADRLVRIEDGRIWTIAVKTTTSWLIARESRHRAANGPHGKPRSTSKPEEDPGA